MAWYHLQALWAVVLGTAALFFLAVELGHRVGRAAIHAVPARAADKSFVFSLSGALLTLLALLLGFSFSIVEERFASRRQLVIEEANAIATSYLRAGTLPPPHGERVRLLLKEYTQMRSPENEAELRKGLKRAAELHEHLWFEAQAAANEAPSPIVAVFIQSLNEVIDLHQERVTVGLYYRLPDVLVGCLYVVSVLTLSLLGFTTAFVAISRVFVTGTVVVVVIITHLLILVLDRPYGGLIEVSSQALANVRGTIADHPPRPPGAP